MEATTQTTTSTAANRTRNVHFNNIKYQYILFTGIKTEYITNASHGKDKMKKKGV